MSECPVYVVSLSRGRAREQALWTVYRVSLIAKGQSAVQARAPSSHFISLSLLLSFFLVSLHNLTASIDSRQQRTKEHLRQRAFRELRLDGRLCAHEQAQ